MKGWTATSGGRVGRRIVRQEVVIEVVALGFIRRMVIFGVDISATCCSRPEELSGISEDFASRAWKICMVNLLEML